MAWLLRISCAATLAALGFAAIAKRLELPNAVLAVGASALVLGLVAALLPRRKARKIPMLAARGAAVLALPLFVAGRTLELLPATALGALLALGFSAWAIAQRRWSAVGVTSALAIAVVVATPLELQLADRRYHPALAKPEFGPGAGPVVLFDAGHHNFHRLDKAYAAFGDLLRADGFRVQELPSAATGSSLAAGKVFVSVGALHESNLERWELPTPSAFAPEEIEALRGFVESGGGLLLVVEHLPFAGASAELAKAFGLEVPNGFTLKSLSGGFDAQYVDLFSRASRTLHSSPVTDGRGGAERVEQVASFTGVAFPSPPGVICLLSLGPGHETVLPKAAWEFEGAPRRNAEGGCQAAVLPFGKGRVAVVGEAAMLSAQLVGGLSFKPYGMNAPGAEENHRFALNLVRWLAGVY